MENYKNKLREYEITIETTTGTGSRGQYYVDRAYEELKAAHARLGLDERECTRLPPLIRVGDDGYFGMSGAFTALANSMRNSNNK